MANWIAVEKARADGLRHAVVVVVVVVVVCPYVTAGWRG